MTGNGNLIRSRNSVFFPALLELVLLLTALATMWPQPLPAQTPTGSIAGTITDKSGAVIPHAKITVTQKARGQVFLTTADADGNYAVSALAPGEYTVRAEAPNFKTGRLRAQVEVGRVTTGNISLEVGEVKQTVNVAANEETEVDASQNTVSGIVSEAQLQNLPTDGRNFLDLASLEPGIQVIDAAALEMTKTGFTAISIAGSEGRTTRIQVDGIDITDETVGASTQNFSIDGIGGYQISEFSLDPSTSLSNTGAVNLVTRSGSDELHGSAYVFWRDHNFASRIAGLDAPFHRVQGGFEAGGPVQKDRVFWFLNYEDTGQDNSTVLAPPAPFNGFSTFVVTPFHEHLGTGRLDWNISSRMHAFARFSHDDNQGTTGFGASVLSPVLNKNNSNASVVGADITLSRVTHSLRYGHINFADYLDPTQPAGVPSFPLQILFQDTGTTFGPSFLANQHSLQTNDQVRYDGTFVLRSHVLQYGVNYSHISANLFGAPFSAAPEALTFSSLVAPGTDPTNPLDYIPFGIIFGNGLGFLSDRPSHGFPFGGFTNNRLALYFADSWKGARDVTVNSGLRWERDPGQVNSDIVRPAILDTVVSGESGREPVDEDNFGPTLGIAWNVRGRDTTVVRGGAGIYYETNIFENDVFDQVNFLPLSIAPEFPLISNITGLSTLTGPSGDTIFNFNSVAAEPLSASASQIVAAQAQFQAESQAATASFPAGPPAFEPPGALPGTQNVSIGPMIERHFTQPYSIQTNIGIQHKFARNLLVQADYVRNRGVHLYLVRDYNRVGAANTLDSVRAQQSIQATLAQCGASSIDQAIQGCPNFPNGRPANIEDFVGNGLGAGFAFPGNNENFGSLSMIGTQGLSSYNGLLVKVIGRTDRFGRYVSSATWGVSYALSRFDATQSDQANALNNQALNNDCTTCLYGPVGEDRTHQLSAYSMVKLPFGFHWNTVTHISSPLPVTLQLAEVTGGPGEIFFTDLNGDGHGGDVLPGTNIGSYGRGISGVSGLNAAINNFNQNFAGQLTPASQALVTAGLFTSTQLGELGALIPPIQSPPATQVTPSWFWTTDFRLERTFGFRDRFQIEPAVDIFNVFNRVNFDPIGNVLSGVLSGAPGTVNGTAANQRRNAFGLGTGAFSPGIPRALQFLLRVNF